MAKKDIAISIRDIHKEFILPQSKNTSLKQAAVNIVRKNKKTTHKVLDGVSFDIQKGDFFGIVGRNGSGKSTLLKLIAGVYYPTGGSIEVNGGLTPFIELGVGFNPELSGCDNVYLNGALLGFTRDQMDVMYDDIVEFAELGPFMDQKLKNYSSGMQVRLAFSIAIKAKNDVLIFDEVLAVGDEAFQQKCLDIFEKYRRAKQTVILVTHDMDTVRKFCTKAALISEGKLLSIGNPNTIADMYSNLNQVELSSKIENEEKSTLESYEQINLKAKVNNPNTGTNKFKQGDDVDIEVTWTPHSSVDSFVVNVYKNSGEHVTGMRVPIREKDRVNIKVHPLWGPGNYYLLVEIRDKNDDPAFESYEGSMFKLAAHDIKGQEPWSGLTFVDHEISY